MLLAAACSSSGGSASGTVHGQSFSPKDAISNNASQGALIVLADASGLCGDLQAGTQPKSVSALLIAAADVSGSTQTPPAAPGAYSVSLTQTSAHEAGVFFTRTDSSCNAISGDAASGISGSVTFTSVGSGGYSGSYDVTFDSGDRLTGTFAASACTSLTTSIGGTCN